MNGLLNIRYVLYEVARDRKSEVQIFHFAVQTLQPESQKRMVPGPKEIVMTKEQIFNYLEMFFNNFWIEEDFDGHPDFNCMEVERLPEDVQNLLSVVGYEKDVRYGRGYALSDGIYVFPGEHTAVEIITKN